MSALFLLIGFSLVIAIGFLVAFFWANGSGQFDDEYTPAVRAILDDRLPSKPDSTTTSLETNPES